MGTIRDLNELTAPVAADYVLVADTSDLVDKDKKMLLSRLAIKSGTPVAGNAAVWLDANNVQDGGIAASDQYLRSNLFLVDAAFTTNSGKGRFKTIALAMAACSGGETILIAPGTYTENVTFSQVDVKLVGAGRPSWDGTNLSGGTIIIGVINCNTMRGAGVRDLGVDIRTTASVDAVQSGTATASAYIGQTFRNLVLIGKGSAVTGNRGHGVLCTSGDGNLVTECKFYIWYHGVGLRCSDSMVSDCYFYSCMSDAVIIKGDTGSGNAYRCTITNCVIDGDPANNFLRGGPMRVQNNNAATVTRYHTICNITANNTGESVVLIQQVVGSCSNVMVSNVIAFNGGDASIRADFDVDTATDVHFSNCMSANRANGYGFRSTGSRVRALNCSSDFSGAGRVAAITGWDYLDLGSGVGTDYARVQNIVIDRTSTLLPVRDVAMLCGFKAISSGVTTPVLTCAWSGVGNTSSLAIEIMINYESGSIARFYTYRIMIVRPNSTTLVSAMEAVGSAPLNTAGAGNNMTVAVDVSTANTAIVTITGVTGPGSAAYTARVLSLTTSSWNITP